MPIIKKNRTIWICIDFRSLNLPKLKDEDLIINRSMPQPYPLRRPCKLRQRFLENLILNSFVLAIMIQSLRLTSSEALCYTSCTTLEGQDDQGFFHFSTSFERIWALCIRYFAYLCGRDPSSMCFIEVLNLVRCFIYYCTLLLYCGVSIWGISRNRDMT